MCTCEMLPCSEEMLEVKLGFSVISTFLFNLFNGTAMRPGDILYLCDRKQPNLNTLTSGHLKTHGEDWNHLRRGHLWSFLQDKLSCWMLTHLC